MINIKYGASFFQLRGSLGDEDLASALRDECFCRGLDPLQVHRTLLVIEHDREESVVKVIWCPAFTPPRRQRSPGESGKEC